MTTQGALFWAKGLTQAKQNDVRFVATPQGGPASPNKTSDQIFGTQPARREAIAQQEYLGRSTRADFTGERTLPTYLQVTAETINLHRAISPILDIKRKEAKANCNWQRSSTLATTTYVGSKFDVYTGEGQGISASTPSPSAFRLPPSTGPDGANLWDMSVRSQDQPESGLPIESSHHRANRLKAG
ncbi:hypothetical protein CIB48_g323 [Xylaria polymorpha]|nr:hypothetical protein CIB48_g323 [Xylaria polymorpha]